MRMASEPKESKRAIALVETAAATAAQAAPAQAAPAKKIVEGGAIQARATMEKGMEQMTKTAEGFFKAAEEAAEFGRGNLEAMTKSAQLFAVGFQDIGKQVFAVTQALTDHALESAKALAAVKSLKEAADIQAAFAKASMERSMSEAAKLQEATYKLAETAYAPLTARMTLAVEKFGKPLAA
jgi:phasin family protein